MIFTGVIVDKLKGVQSFLFYKLIFLVLTILLFTCKCLSQENVITGDKSTSHAYSEWNYLVHSEMKFIYTNGETTYGFEAKNDKKTLAFTLKGGENPEYFISGKQSKGAKISYADNSLIFYLPEIFGVSHLEKMPMIVNYDMIKAKELKEMKPSIVLDIPDTTFAKLGEKGLEDELYGRLDEIYFSNTYEREVLTFLDHIEYSCYRNRSVALFESGSITLDYWFEPEKYGFVKFLLTLPDGKKILFNLTSVVENQ